MKRRDDGRGVKGSPELVSASAAVLALLASTTSASFGLEMIGLLARYGVRISQGTMYATLARLEREGLVRATEDPSHLRGFGRPEGGRPARYLLLTRKGRALADRQRAQVAALFALFELGGAP